MTDLATRVYHRMPAVVRSMAASLRGYYLRSWRYGAETESLVAEALARESWSREQWRAWQQERLSLALHRAATRVPYYRNQWAERRRRGDRASWEYLENWPVLEKDSLRQNPKAFVAEGLDVRRMFHVHTSGTTGKSLDLWYSKETARAWYALFEARCRRWYEISRHDRWAILGGQLVSPARSRRPPFWVWNAALNQLYMSSYHLAPDLIPHYLDALRRYRVHYLLGYTSSLYELAQEALRLGRRDLRLAVVLTNAEPLFDYQREVIEEAFQCPVRETYGMAEIAAAASECRSEGMHLWPEVSHIEVMSGDERVSPGTAGDLVATGLLNLDMPLIRYRVGDRVVLKDADETCDCGRTLSLLDSIEGRLDDILYTPDGRRIGRLDPVFKVNLPVREAQIIQESIERIRVLYVPTAGFTSADGRSIIERLRSRMGDVEVSLEKVDSVPRGANGKFRAVICNIPREEVRRITSPGRLITT